MSFVIYIELNKPNITYKMTVYNNYTLKERESEIRSVLPDVSCVSITETQLTVKREDSGKCAERDTHMLAVLIVRSCPVRYTELVLIKASVSFISAQLRERWTPSQQLKHQIVCIFEDVCSSKPSALFSLTH